MDIDISRILSREEMNISNDVRNLIQQNDYMIYIENRQESYVLMTMNAFEKLNAFNTASSISRTESASASTKSSTISPEDEPFYEKLRSIGAKFFIENFEIYKTSFDRKEKVNFQNVIAENLGDASRKVRTSNMNTIFKNGYEQDVLKYICESSRLSKSEDSLSSRAAELLRKYY